MTPHTLCLSGEWVTIIIFMCFFSFVSSHPLCCLWPGSKITHGLRFPAASRTATQPGSTSWSCWCSRSRTLWCLRVQTDPKTWRWTPRVSVNIPFFAISFFIGLSFISCPHDSFPVALRDDLYFDVGCLLALSLVHGGPPVGFFSHTLYQCLFNYPPNQPLTVTHMTPDTHFRRQVSRVSEERQYQLQRLWLGYNQRLDIDCLSDFRSQRRRLWTSWKKSRQPAGSSWSWPAATNQSAALRRKRLWWRIWSASLWSPGCSCHCRGTDTLMML